ncbi:M23 family metallopeptidase [Halomonas sp. 18H]|uniref:M23 family metallopeptidase n=1 Tax=Halomonas almeriensis TaxID=308163 RepID=UPI00222E5E05|nr:MULTISPECIES: M23 family metallopeptidase [Halomonas]MCW4151816.1 M23 family metallopeptidase [Halomonas sp. 18H]MDN3554062.1 M23 family metallopeptidase [Halomonas almeriensis]
MAQRAVAGKGCRTGLALIGLTLLLSGCAAQSHGPSGDTATGATASHKNIAGNWVAIRRGDTLGSIAQRADVPLVRLKRFNPDVEPRSLAVGQRVLVPSQRERAPSSGPYRYQIRPGDTFSSVARRFATSAQVLASANQGVEATDLKVGQMIQVPLDGSSADATVEANPRPATTGASSASASAPTDAASSNRQWPWPLDNYQIARRFGKDDHGTLQPMLLSTHQGARAMAVADGQVRFANSMRQLGKVVIVHHPDNLQSVYARCRSLVVESGEQVQAGSPLCQVGQASNGQHQLLFDMRQGGKPMNPARVLRQATPGA